jgi:ketosteroid isomerase-like protein
MSDAEPVHPARRAGLLSQHYVANGQREKWLDLFADDGVIQDPVGPSPLDPTGKGHRGKAAIAAFWDNVIAKGQVSFDYPKSYAAGDECAFTGAVINTFPGGKEFRAHGVFVYRVNEVGKLLSLRAYWEFANPTGASHEPVRRTT